MCRKLRRKLHQSLELTGQELRKFLATFTTTSAGLSQGVYVRFVAPGTLTRSHKLNSCFSGLNTTALIGFSHLFFGKYATRKGEVAVVREIWNTLFFELASSGLSADCSRSAQIFKYSVHCSVYCSNSILQIARTIVNSMHRCMIAESPLNRLNRNVLKHGTARGPRGISALRLLPIPADVTS